MSLSKKQGILLGEGNAFGKDECFWKRRMLLEKTNAFGKDLCFWKREYLHSGVLGSSYTSVL
jgi:hypothetical protein